MGDGVITPDQLAIVGRRCALQTKKSDRSQTEQWATEQPDQSAIVDQHAPQAEPIRRKESLTFFVERISS